MVHKLSSGTVHIPDNDRVPTDIKARDPDIVDDIGNAEVVDGGDTEATLCLPDVNDWCPSLTGGWTFGANVITYLAIRLGITPALDVIISRFFGVTVTFGCV